MQRLKEGSCESTHPLGRLHCGESMSCKIAYVKYSPHARDPGHGVIVMKSSYCFTSWDVFHFIQSDATKNMLNYKKSSHHL